MTLWISRKSFRAGCGSSTSASRAIGFRRTLLSCFACVLLAPLAAAQDKNSSQTPEPLAIFAGQPINEDQLSPNAQLQLQRMMQQVWAVKRRALQMLLNQKLVEAEAKKRGVSAEDLLKSEVDSKVADPSEDDVSASYRARQDLKNQAFDQVREKIRQQLRIEAIQKVRTAFMQGLMEQAASDGAVVVLLRPPKVEVPVDPLRLRGDPKAPVTIVEFSDFSCPYCGKAEATVRELLQKYPGRIKLGYRDFPLNQIHPRAQLAAEASRCAGEQGKYWEYHDLLFAHPDTQGHDDLIAHARALKLDDQQFDACLSGGKYKREIERDAEMGSSSGVSGAPAFFINGNFLGGAQPADVFERVIDRELSSASKPAK